VLDPLASRDDAVRCIVARLLSAVDAKGQYPGYAVGTVSAHNISLKSAASIPGLYFLIWSGQVLVLEGFIRAQGIGRYGGGVLLIEKWIRGNWEKQIFVRFRSNHILPSRLREEVCYKRPGERTRR
jgi:hypothetical protein